MTSTPNNFTGTANTLTGTRQSFAQSQLSSVWPEWTITSTLGKGTFGHVYEILRNDLGTNYKCALKVLQLEADESDSDLEEFVRSVSREIDMMMQLKGAPHIVAIEDYAVLRGEGTRTILIRMELLESVEKIRQRKGSLDRREALQLGLDMCTALISCEQRNIIHRDIKLSNIFYSDKGGYKLGDFGISRTMDSIHEKVSMSSAGTIQYIAPEVYFGYKYDSTVDIYSLGIALYILLNNNLPPLCNEYNLPQEEITMSMIHEANMKRLRGERFQGPSCADDRLSSVICTACHPDPAKRFQTAEQFRDALLAYMDNKPIILPGKDPLADDTFSLYNTKKIIGSGTARILDSDNTVFVSGIQGNPNDPAPDFGQDNAQKSAQAGPQSNINHAAPVVTPVNRTGAGSSSSGSKNGDGSGRKKSPLPYILIALLVAIIVCAAALLSGGRSSGTSSVSTGSGGQTSSSTPSSSDARTETVEEAVPATEEEEETQPAAADYVDYVVSCVDTDGNTLSTETYTETNGAKITVYAPEISGYTPTNEQITFTLSADSDNSAVFVYAPEDTGPAMDIPSQDTLVYNGHTYYAYETAAIDSFRQAQEYCESRGGYLAVINDGFENAALYDYVFYDLGMESAYFGLTDENHEGSWEWVDGTPYSYENWLDKQPDNKNGKEHYALFYYKDTPYTWNDGDFGKDPTTGKVIFLIEWDTE